MQETHATGLSREDERVQPFSKTISRIGARPGCHLLQGGPLLLLLYALQQPSLDTSLCHTMLGCCRGQRISKQATTAGSCRKRGQTCT